MSALLHGAVDALERMLKNPDWRAKDAAISHIFQVNKLIERIDVIGHIQHSHHHDVSENLVMDDATRAKAMELLQLTRQKGGVAPRQLPARFQNPNHIPSTMRVVGSPATVITATASNHHHVAITDVAGSGPPLMG